MSESVKTWVGTDVVLKCRWTYIVKNLRTSKIVYKNIIKVLMNIFITATVHGISSQCKSINAGEKKSSHREIKD